MMMPANERSTFYRQPQCLNPVQIGPGTILNLARKKQTLKNVIAVLKRLEPDEFIDFMLDFYEAGLEKFGDDWGYADQLTVLYAVASLLPVENYLEIGVFRGRSFAVLSSLAGEANLFGFDLWVENYSGLENPGPEFVRGQLARVGYQGEAAFISGRSQETLPAYLESHPDLYFDIVTVDGDHSYAGALSDLQNVSSRVKLGGVLVFDDIRHPKHRVLEYVWDEVIGSHPDFQAAKFTDIGHGVAVAVRIGAGEGNSQQGDDVQERLRTSFEGPAAGDPAALQGTIRTLNGELREQASTIHHLKTHLQESEADRSARLEAIQFLEKLLRESESDRSARLEAIHSLENLLQECEADRAARLNAVHSLENLLQACEADLAARLEANRKLEALKQEHEEALSWAPVRALLSMREKFK